MTRYSLSNASAFFTRTAVGAGLAACLFAAPALAISDNEEVLIGGNSIGSPVTIFTSPGMSNNYQADFPGTGLGEKATQIQMPAGGTLRKLRLTVVTENAATGGSIEIMLRKNGNNTALTCTLTAAGTCTTGTTSVKFKRNNKIAIRITNSLTGAGTTTYTYSMLLD